MHSEGTAKSVAKWVALGALFLLPFTPLVVTSSYFFPFITGKAFYLRILIEVAVVAWAVLALLDKRYRPRFSWIGATVVGFVLWMFVADALAINATKAFWSNFERMEGWVLLVHLLGLFFSASAVLRVEKKWRAWFLWSLGISVVIVGHALLQGAGSGAFGEGIRNFVYQLFTDPKSLDPSKHIYPFPIHQGSVRIDASLGNSIYLAIYLLFTTFVAGWLALTEKRAWLKWCLLTFAVIAAVLIFFTGTRGTIVGLVGALVLTALLTALTAGHRARHYAIGALILLLALAGTFYAVRDSSFVQENYVLQRVASITWNDLKVRRTIWNMAFKGVMERPLTGYGQEGFNYIFNKFYNPSLYAQEQWFDRAHNAFIDWFTAGGIPALLLYLSLFGSAIILLWKSSELSRPERIALTAVLVGYAVHNFFVFDNLYSYIYFFAVLALIDSQVSRPIEKLENISELAPEDGVTYALPIAAVALFSLIWFVNVPGMKTASGLIKAMSPNPAGVSANISAFEELSSRSSFAGQEIREQLVSFAGAVVRSSGATNEEKQRVVALAMAEMKKQVDAYPQDAREHLQLSYVYRIVGDTENALKEISNAIILSPGKISFYIDRGTVEWDTGDVKAVQADFNNAYELAPQFTDLALYAAVGNIVAGNQEEASRILISAFGTDNLDSDILSTAYYRAKDWNRLISFWKLRTEKPGASAETWFSLASAYYTSGDKYNATRVINRAIELFPDAAAAGATAIKQIEASK